MDARGEGPAAGPRIPESDGDPPIAVDSAAHLMGRLGFVAFRTPPGALSPASCLMAILRDVPTREHFDPERVTYWAVDEGPAHVETIERGARRSFVGRFSWGRIRLVDRLGMRNDFVAFGGDVSTHVVGRDALLVIFRSTAPILRLPGHSQRQDRSAPSALAFLSRVVPCLWDPRLEAVVGSAPPEALYVAFLEFERDHHPRASDEIDPRSALGRELELLARVRPDAVDAGRGLLAQLGLRARRAPQPWSGRERSRASSEAAPGSVSRGGGPVR